jgi:hypothetical protein
LQEIKISWEKGGMTPGVFGVYFDNYIIIFTIIMQGEGGGRKPGPPVVPVRG